MRTNVDSDIRCNEPRIHCSQFPDRIVQARWVYNYTHENICERDITLSIGSVVLDLQRRKRNFNFTIDRFGYWGGYTIVIVDKWGEGEIGCGGTADGGEEVKFSEKYETHDTELLYLDLRNDVVVTKETSSIMDVDESTSNPTASSITVFNGQTSPTYYPFVYEDGLPIKETITYNLYIGTEKTELNTEEIGKAYPFANILMPTFPTSPYGIRFNDAWAADTEWYRQDTRKLIDGDAYLFWPEWEQNMCQISSAMDAVNRDLLLAATNVLTLQGKDTYTTSEGTPDVIASTLFEGSIAFDSNKNMFCSIGVPSNSLLVNPEYTFLNKLVIGGTEATIPTEQVVDRVMDGDKQETNNDGSLKWTDAKESECNAWWPIAPL